MFDSATLINFFVELKLDIHRKAFLNMLCLNPIS